MFGTFRYNINTNDVEHVQLERIDGFAARGYTRNACNTCRTRKLKCSGEKNGCERCLAASRPCIYPSHISGDGPAEKPRPKSRDDRFEKGDETIQALNKQPGMGDVNARPEASKEDSPIPRTTFSGFEWTTPSTPSGSDSFWDFFSDESQQATNTGQDSSLGTTQCHKLVTDDCNSPGKRKSLQDPIKDMDFGADMAGILYNVNPKQPNNPMSNASSTSSTALLTSETINTDQAFWETLEEGNFPFSRDFPDAHTCETEELQGSADTWETSFKLSSAAGPPVDHAQVPQTPESCMNGLSAPAMSSLSAIPRHAAIPVSTSSRPLEHAITPPSRSTCLCVSMMLETLEKMGTQCSAATDRGSGVELDIVLMALACGMHATEQILACRQCNACVDNSMLLASISQQLGMLAKTVVACWSSQVRSNGRHATQKRRRYHETSSHSLQLSELLTMDNGDRTMHPFSNDNPIHDMSQFLETDIALGNYEIQLPEIRLRVVHYALLLHIDKLCALLGHITNRMSSNWGAQKLVANQKSRVRVCLETLRSSSSHAQMTLESAATNGCRA